MCIRDRRETPIVNFLGSHENSLEHDIVPNCYHFAASKLLVKSSRVPVVIEGVRVPLMLDTGAEVSILSTKFAQSLFPNKNFTIGAREVRVLGVQRCTFDRNSL